MSASSSGRGSGQSVAGLAVEAQPQQRASGAPARRHVHGSGVAVADAGPGATLAEVRKRLSAQRGRPAAARKDHGSERPNAAALRADDRRARPCLDALSHAAAGRRTRPSPPQPAGERFVSAWGRASGQLQHPLRACLAPPPGRTTARVRKGPRFGTWADRVLPLAPPGGAKRGSM